MEIIVLTKYLKNRFFNNLVNSANRINKKIKKGNSKNKTIAYGKKMVFLNKTIMKASCKCDVPIWKRPLV